MNYGHVIMFVSLNRLPIIESYGANEILASPNSYVIARIFLPISSCTYAIYFDRQVLLTVQVSYNMNRLDAFLNISVSKITGLLDGDTRIPNAMI